MTSFENIHDIHCNGVMKGLSVQVDWKNIYNIYNIHAYNYIPVNVCLTLSCVHTWL